MSTTDKHEEAVEILQQLGLKEYEARCFVGLSRLSTATAKRLSETTDVPRTRVYDAIRVLEAQGLVEIQHSSPQRFRAVPLEEATETLRDQYENRVDRLTDALEPIELVEDEDPAPVHEVWAMSGHTAIENRTNELIGEAAEEVVLVIGHDAIFDAELAETLNALDDHVDVVLGAPNAELEERIRNEIPGATTFVSGLEWLDGSEGKTEDVTVGRLLLADRSTILVSSYMLSSHEEHAIFGEGFGNGLVVLARRLLAFGLLPRRDPKP